MLGGPRLLRRCFLHNHTERLSPVGRRVGRFVVEELRRAHPDRDLELWRKHVFEHAQEAVTALEAVLSAPVLRPDHPGVDAVEGADS